MKCLLYIRFPIHKGLPQYRTFDTCLVVSRNYAKEKGWNIVDRIVDIDDFSSRNIKTKIKNLHSYLEKKHPRIDMVIMATSDIPRFTDFALLKRILSKSNIELTMLIAPDYK